MKTVVVATGVSTDPLVASSIEHAALAAEQCIDAAGIDRQEVNFIFNVGVYRDHNMVEPSMAALIQKELAINRDFTRFPVSSPAFSTDLMKGAIGALSAFQTADALFRAGRDGYVLVVSSDVHPSGRTSEGFAVRPCGAAVLLGSAEQGGGFSRFCFADSDETDVGQSSYVDFRGGNLEGRTTITVDTTPDFYPRMLAFAGQVGRGFIERNRIDMQRTKLVVPTFTQSFAQDLGERVGCPPQNVVDPWVPFGNTYTSAYGIGLHLALQPEEPREARPVLLLGAGAGLSAGCALYGVQP